MTAALPRVRRATRERLLTVASWSALAAAGIGIIGLLFTGGPYGGDVKETVAASGVLVLLAYLAIMAVAAASAPLAGRELPRAWMAALAPLVLGAALVGYGAYVAWTGDAFWFRTGLWQALGWVGAAPWLLLMSRGEGDPHDEHHRAEPFGLTEAQRFAARLVAGLLVAGLFAVPFLLSGANPLAESSPFIAAPWHAWLALGVGGLTHLVLLPMWLLGFGWTVMRRSARRR